MWDVGCGMFPNVHVWGILLSPYHGPQPKNGFTALMAETTLPTCR
jgi:hypothetical protein